MPELGFRVDDELPRFVAMLTEGDDLCAGLPDGGRGFALAPSASLDHARSGPSDGDESGGPGAAGAVEDGERLLGEDVRMSPELEEGNGAVDVGGGGRSGRR